MVNVMVELIPVVEASHGEFRWAPAIDAYPYWIELNGKTSDADVARLVATLADYSDIATSGALPDVIEALESADELILPGGLMVRDDGVEIAPSSCGLEDWREWHRVKPGGGTSRLGHDPAPLVECLSDAAVIRAESGLDKRAESGACATVSYQELGNALGQAGEARSRCRAAAGRGSRRPASCRPRRTPAPRPRCRRRSARPARSATARRWRR
jgi:hypothetical protein